tara:strand:+ start:145 stop:564 length:420 start_codon:yes stop_codon:yes gene_type:complete
MSTFNNKLHNNNFTLKEAEKELKSLTNRKQRGVLLEIVADKFGADEADRIFKELANPARKAPAKKTAAKKTPINDLCFLGSEQAKRWVLIDFINDYHPERKGYKSPNDLRALSHRQLTDIAIRMILSFDILNTLKKGEN